MNPLREFLEYEKTAAPFGLTGRDIGQMATMGMLGAATTAAVASAIPAAQSVYNAATKGRNFRKMLAFDQELKEMHKENPKYVNAGFNTLHSLNPTFAKDPMVASAFVRQVAADPASSGAFSLAQEALRTVPRPSPTQEAFVSGGGVGISATMHDFMRRQQEARETPLADKMKMEQGMRMQQQENQQRFQLALEGQKALGAKERSLQESALRMRQQAHQARLQAGLEAKKDMLAADRMRQQEQLRHQLQTDLEYEKDMLRRQR